LIFEIIGSFVYYLSFFSYLKKSKIHKKDKIVSNSFPLVVIVVSCHNEAPIIEQTLKNIKNIQYPADRFRIYTIIDNCSDGSLEIARNQGVQTYVRNDANLMGKGYALDEFIGKYLRHETFDIAVLLDADAQVEYDFLREVVSYFSNGCSVIQGVTKSKNMDDNSWVRVGDIIQAVIRVHQEGRSELGLNPLCIGSHGIALSHSALEKLGWHTTTKRTGDDLELSLRCFLSNIPICYAETVHVKNELPIDGFSVLKQRRRWAISTLQLAPYYIPKLLKKAFAGNIRALDALFGVLLLPSFSTLMIVMVLSFAVFMALSYWFWYCVIWTVIFFVLLAGYSILLAIIISKEGYSLNMKMLGSFIKYTVVKFISLTQSVFMVNSKSWWPTKHTGE